MTADQVSVIPNPVIPGFNPDPSVCRVGDEYFLATSTLEFYPGLPIYHSRDLVNWQLIGHALNRPSQLFLRRVEPGCGAYAPTLRYHKGRFYVATCCVYSRSDRLVCWEVSHSLDGADLRINEARGFYVWTDDIFYETKWSEPIYFDALGIDQDLFFDDNDKVYLCTSRALPFRKPNVEDQDLGAVIFGTEIELSTGRSIGRPTLLRRSRRNNKCAEGPHIYKKDGWYYLLVAEGGTEDEHQVHMARSRHPLGPYEEPPDGLNPFLYNGANKTVQATGHADLVRDTRGNWWAFFLATRKQANGISQLGRESWIVPVEWQEGEWPIFNGKKPVGLQVVTRHLPLQKPFVGWRDDFDQDLLARSWYRVRTPLKQDYSLIARPGYLTITGNAFNICDVEAPAMLLQKQTQLEGIWSTALDFAPSTTNEEAGIVVYWSCYAYAALVVRRGVDDGSRVVTLRWLDPDRIEDTIIEKHHPLVSPGAITLRIHATQTSYTFAVQEADCDEAIELGTISSAVLQRHRVFDSPYTGTHFGLFAQGSEGFICADPAYFSYAAFDLVR